MSRNRNAAVLIALALVAASCSASKTDTENASSERSDTTSTAAPMNPVQRGQYLVTVSGCHDCHTPGTLFGAPDMKRALSGSELGWKGPWGVSYPGNLTPDRTTGLGTWTDEEIRSAIQNGVRKNGAPIAPPMPWPEYAHFTREDVMAVIAYLRSLPAVVHQAPARVPPNGTPLGPVLELPPPPAWDVPEKPAS